MLNRRLSVPKMVAVGAFGLLLAAGAAACGSSSSGSSSSSASRGGGATKTAATGSPVKIGASLTLTGALSTFGTEQTTGYDYAVNQVNSQGGLDLGGTQVVYAFDYRDGRTRPFDGRLDGARSLADPSIDGGFSLSVVDVESEEEAHKTAACF